MPDSVLYIHLLKSYLLHKHGPQKFIERMSEITFPWSSLCRGSSQQLSAQDALHFNAFLDVLHAAPHDGSKVPKEILLQLYRVVPGVVGKQDEPPATEPHGRLGYGEIG